MGRKKSKSRQKRIDSIDIRINSPLDKSASTLNFASPPSLPSQKSKRLVIEQTDDCFPILPVPKVTIRNDTYKKDFPKLPILSKSMLELGNINAESFLPLSWNESSCDDIPFASTLTPQPSYLKLLELERDAIQMDQCRSFELDCLLFKDSIPGHGEYMKREMAKIINSLHPESDSSFKNKICYFSSTLSYSVSVYNSVCKMAIVCMDMLTAKETLLSEKVSRQRSRIEELEKNIEKLTDLVRETNARALVESERRHSELDQKDKIIKSLEEEIKNLKVNKFREQSPFSKKSSSRKKVSRQRPRIGKLENKVEKLSDLKTNEYASDKFEKQGTEFDQKGDIIQSLEEIKILKSNKFRDQISKFGDKDKTIISVQDKFYSGMDEENKRIQYLENAASLEEQKLDTNETIDESQQNLEIGMFGSSCKSLIPVQKSEDKIAEFDKILELGKDLAKKLLSVQNANEMASLQDEANYLKAVVSDRKKRLEDLVAELNLLKSQNASLTDQLHSKVQILETLDIELSSLKNNILVKSTKIQELEKLIENLNDSLETSNGLVLSLQEENKSLKQKLTQLEIEITNNKTSFCHQATQCLARDTDYAMEGQTKNLLKNDEIQQVLQKTKNLSSSHFPSADEESFHFNSTFMKDTTPNDVLIEHRRNPKRNNIPVNSFKDDLQNLKHIIEIQQLSLQRQSSYVQKLSQDISSIQLKNYSLPERLSTNKSKLTSLEVLAEVALTSSKSSILEHDASREEIGAKIVKNRGRDLMSFELDISKKENLDDVSEHEIPDVSKPDDFISFI